MVQHHTSGVFLTQVLDLRHAHALVKSLNGFVHRHEGGKILIGLVQGVEHIGVGKHLDPFGVLLFSSQKTGNRIFLVHLVGAAFVRILATRHEKQDNDE